MKETLKRLRGNESDDESGNESGNESNNEFDESDDESENKPNDDESDDEPRFKRQKRQKPEILYDPNFDENGIPRASLTFATLLEKGESDIRIYNDLFRGKHITEYDILTINKKIQDEIKEGRFDIDLLNKLKELFEEINTEKSKIHQQELTKLKGNVNKINFFKNNEVPTMSLKSGAGRRKINPTKSKKNRRQQSKKNRKQQSKKNRRQQLKRLKTIRKNQKKSKRN